MSDDMCCCGVEGMTGFVPNMANMNHLGSLHYSEAQQRRGTGRAFRALVRASRGGDIADANSYAENMELARKTRKYLQVMGLTPTLAE